MPTLVISAKPVKTAADYLAMAVCPALIMLLVGSLVFFLLQVGYAGPWMGRLRWTLFWFVFAMVLVSRISIEQSAGAAFLYGSALAGATLLLLTQYLGFIWQVWLLLGVIWWAANKITRDCTLIDDDQDASGEGLLQTTPIAHWTRRRFARLKTVSKPRAENGPPPVAEALAGAEPSSASGHFPSLPRGTQPGTPKALPRSPGARGGVPPAAVRNQPAHAPGLWVLYFSFAAVPVFGVGELLLRPGDAGGRGDCFVWLLAYMAAALVLLILTSFLGLRRYLRQRYLQMPPAMAGAWMTRGVVMVGAILLLAWLLPRPSAPYSLADVVTKIGSPAQRAARQAATSTEGAEGDGAAKASTEQPETSIGQPARPPQHQGELPPSASQGKGQRDGGSAAAQPMQNLAATVLRIQKPFSILVAVVVLGIALYRFWPDLRSGWHLFVASWLAFWNRWSSGRGKARARHPQSAKAPGTPQALLLPDPFQSGRATSMSLAELIRYSFDALKLWAAARGSPIEESKTPLELAESLAQREPAIGHEILLLSSYYSRVTYSEELPDADCLRVLRSLWSVIGFQRPQGAK